MVLTERELMGIAGKWITQEDRKRSYTSHCLFDVIKTLVTSTEGYHVEKMLDIGCGFGGIAGTIGEVLDCREVHGVDIDEVAVRGAKKKGVLAQQVDVYSQRLPYDSGYFDLAVSFGVFDYFPFYDPAIREVKRVLKPGGYVCISLPNLASWHNRLALIFGYQPRDVEVSSEVLVGVHPVYKARGEKVVGHIHTVTTRGFQELMEYYGFQTEVVKGINTLTRWDIPYILRLANKLMETVTTPGLSKRFVYVGKLP